MFDIIETKKLIVRRFKESDWKDVFKYTSNPEVFKYLPEEPFDEVAAKRFVWKNTYEKIEKYPVILKEDNVLIGHMVFHPWAHSTWEIGWVFNPEYHGKGYATEAAKEILQYAFDTMKIHRVIATCDPNNTASYRVMEKLGMRREGYFQKCIWKDEKWHDEYFYSILEEWWIY